MAPLEEDYPFHNEHKDWYCDDAIDMMKKQGVGWNERQGGVADGSRRCAP